MGWLAWGAFVPWLFLLEECSPRRAFGRSYLLGLLFFGGTMGWVGLVAIPGVVLLAPALAFYFAAWGWLANRILARYRGAVAAPLILLPASWVVLEYVRSHLLSGLGWNLLAHTQWNRIPLIQIADLTGVWGLSFLVVLVNAALFLAAGGKRKKKISALAASACLVAAVLAYGTFRLHRLGSSVSGVSRQDTLRVALLQGNVPQMQKWDESFEEAIWKRYLDLVGQAKERRPDLIVWPETAVPGYLEDSLVFARLQGISRSTGIEMLVGLPTEEIETGLPYNSALLLGPDGQEKALYSKIHLVPFGEFIPFKPVLGWLKRFYPVADFAPGKQFTVFPMEPPVSVLVCFEDLFPELARRFVREGAGWLLVITNDAWFDRSAASLQHLQCSVFRAVENRVWVGRAANSGWTGFVDPAGRRLPPPGQIPLYKAGVAVAEIPLKAAGGSPYVRWGDWLPILCLLLTAGDIMRNYHGNARSA